MFRKKTIVITGAMGGYGQDLVQAFTKLGANLILTDTFSNYENVHQIDDCQFKYFQADLSKNSDLENLVINVLKGGVPDVWINNAGIFPFDDIMDVNLNQIDQILAINLRAPFYFCQKIGAAMSQKKSGVICNISSGAASVVRSNGAVYGASKAGLDHLTRSFAVKLGPMGVRVNGVRPGLKTERTVQAISPLHMNTIQKAIPLRRLAYAGEVAGVVCFLCSENASFVTGETISVDGGNAINRRHE